MTSAISLKNVRVSVGHKTLIDQINLEIPAGKITTIIGPNGCGKSTTLKAIARILPCAKGSISFLGKDIHSLSHREFARCLAILTQSPVAPTDLTVQDLVEMGRFPHRSFPLGERQTTRRCSSPLANPAPKPCGLSKR